MKIIGLDVSSKSTGWFVSRRSCGVIKINDKLNLPEKLVFFRQQLETILSKYKLQTLVLEDVHYRRGFSNIHTVKMLSKFGGVATELAASKGLDVILLTPSAARKTLELEGKVAKEDVFNHFNAEFDMGWNFKEHNDITDAWMLQYAWKIKCTE